MARYAIDAEVVREESFAIHDDDLSEGEVARLARKAASSFADDRVESMEVNGRPVVGWCESCGIGLFIGDYYAIGHEGEDYCWACT